MAFAAVQTVGGFAFSASSKVITISSSTVNNLIVVGIIINGTSQSVSSVTDNQSNPYVVSSGLNGGGGRLYQARGVQITGGVTSVTVTLSASNSVWGVAVDEYSGFSAGNTNTSVFDAQTTGTGTGTSLSVSTLTPAATGELIVASGGSLADGNTWTAGSGYTNYGNAAGYVRSEYKLSSGSSETAPWTRTPSTLWAEIATAYKDAPVINIKTFNGLAYASTKTVNGLAIASVKTKLGI